MRRSIVLAAVFSTLAIGTSSALVTTGCSSVDLDGVIYEGTANDEALEELLELTVIDSPPDAAEFTWPSNGEELPAVPAPELCWRQGPAEEARLDPPAEDHGPEGPSLWRVERSASDRSAPRRVGWFDRWFGVNTAYAHGAPLTGKGFLVVFSTAEDPELIRVFTTLHDYTPSPVNMQKLIDAKGPIQAVVTTAIFADGVIMKTGGPFKGIPVTFTIAAPAP